MTEKEIKPLAIRVRDFMEQWNLTHERAADVLGTPAKTLNNWLNDGREPPKCMARLLDVAEKCEEARVVLGVHEKREKRKARGKPFKKGNPYRFPPKVTKTPPKTSPQLMKDLEILSKFHKKVTR